ncbi:hypothetical protein CES85_3992 [Ochrobactrum quorumnocens]|uniref:Uncharacterized protein n=2 Tax=Ochrobactrum quorumnocens TaxID=271865 RepID=A0A248U8X4_9HYPH|nr:hypothetical protein CES85_3992 [[Ochrobactrum] quorumnocens]
MINKFAFGSSEERAAYAAEIDAFLAQHRKDNSDEIAKTTSLDLGLRSYDLIALLKDAPDALSEKDRENLAASLESLIVQLRTSK